MSLTRYHYGLAASVAALAIAAPAAMHVMKQQRGNMFGNVSGNLDVGGGPPAPAAPPPVKPAITGRIATTEAPAPAQHPPAPPHAKPMPPAALADAAPASPPAASPPEAPAPAPATRSAGLGEATAPLQQPDARREQLAKKKLAGGERHRSLDDGSRDKLAALPPAAPGAEAGIAPGKPPSATFYLPRKEDARTAGLQPRVAEPAPVPPQVEEHRDQFQAAPDNPVKQTAAEPVSTFSLDVDTASYSFMRRALNAGVLPQKNAVRIEELINYFPYDYARPETAEVPFRPTVAVLPAPWNADHKLVHIGIKGYAIAAAERPRANLVLLIDTSGSMSPQDRLPLLKNAFRMLVEELKPDDSVAIVTYAGDTRVALEPTKAADKGRILAAIDSLGAHGGTYGEGGIKKAYELAEAAFDPKGVNRIVLGTDGDFNIGISNRDELKNYVERKREKGVFLSVLGVGRGNYNDAMMQALAQNGNGTAAYVDTLNEARKVLVDEASSTLFPIAKDVKIQVEFNPAVVSEYRLIGYETRALKREDFANDKVDAGEVGSGHSVTAIYEITPIGATPAADALRYAKPVAEAAPTGAAKEAAEYGFLKLRYKLPEEAASRMISLPIGPALEQRSIAEASADARFSIAVAGFGQILRGSPYLGSFGFDDVIALANSSKSEDAYGYRAEFVNLVRLAKSARP